MVFSALYHTFVVFAIKAPFACIRCPLLPSLGLNNMSLQNSYHGNKMVPSQYFSQKQYCVCWLRMGLWGGGGWVGGGGGAITFLASGVRAGQHPCVRTPVFACDLRAYIVTPFESIVIYSVFGFSQHPKLRVVSACEAYQQP